MVAQQILSILSAIAQLRDHFVFEGQDVPLNKTCGIFVTMNPGNIEQKKELRPPFLP